MLSTVVFSLAKPLPTRLIVPSPSHSLLPSPSFWPPNLDSFADFLLSTGLFLGSRTLFFLLFIPFLGRFTLRNVVLAGFLCPFDVFFDLFETFFGV